MGITGLPLFAALTEKMKWHQTRQGLLAENVANAETPGFRGRDLKAFDFEDRQRFSSGAAGTTMTTATTDRAHLVATASSGMAFGPRTANSFEITPDGNAVALEDEMMKVTQNQMDYQTVTTLYTRSMRLIRTALGRQG